MVKKGAYFIICRVRRGAVYPWSNWLLMPWVATMHRKKLSAVPWPPCRHEKI